jgi:putative transposase
LLDEKNLLAATRYIERNPVAAGLTDRPEAWQWSSARAHLAGRDDALVVVEPLLHIVSDWKAFLQQESEHRDIYRAHERTGLPMGDGAFLDRCEKALVW